MKVKEPLYDAAAEIEYLRMTFDRLKKFKMLSTGVKSIDDKVYKLYGNWLLPTEEYNAIIFAMKQPGADIEALKLRLEIRRQNDLDDTILPYPASYKIRNRQLIIESMPIYDSGKYRITYVKRTEHYSVVCMDTGKKLHQLKTLDKFLSFIFNQETVALIKVKLWE